MQIINFYPKKIEESHARVLRN